VFGALPTNTDLLTSSKTPTAQQKVRLHTFLLYLPTLHDENFPYIRSFHSSPIRAYLGTNEGEYFLGCLIAESNHCRFEHLLQVSG
jgi:hypothetical protein